MKKFNSRQPLQFTLIIAVGYFILTSLYILTSGKIAAHIATTKESLEKIEMYKGLGFMLFSSIGLFFFCYLLFNKLYKNGIQLFRDREALLLSERKASAGVVASCLAHDANNILSILSLRLEQLSSQLNSTDKGLVETLMRENNDRSPD